MDDSEIPRLCEYCAAIDFEMLRGPTAGDIRRLNQGEEIYGHYPFKFLTSDTTSDSWSLGRQKRIEESSSTCSLCHAITQLIISSNIEARHPALFAENPQCDAMISPVASLAPPVGLLWKLPAEINATRFDKSSLEFKLTRLSLYWTRFDADLPHRPGRVIGRLIDFKPAKEVLSGSDLTSAVLEGCFQIYNTSDSIVNISDLFQDSLLGQDRVLFCGRNRPTQIDINLPKRWLQECVNTHQKCSIYKGIKTPSVSPCFRLIDIKSQSITQLYDVDLTEITYTALSYVWGGPQNPVLKKDNIEALTREGGLYGQCAKTIQDAIDFTAGMGLNYIWVDALCIIQDDTSDQKVQIANMARIYKHALFTIVAGAGKTSKTGLPGLNTSRTGTQHVVLVKAATKEQPAIRLLSTVSPLPGTILMAHYTDVLHWSTRGWTLQEKVLSRRILTFTDQQLYWDCRCGHWWEETFVEADMVSLIWHFLEGELILDPVVKKRYQLPDHQQQAWYQLKQLIYNFGSRSFTKEGDALHGISALLDECSTYVNVPFLWGLPASARFEQSLCWETYPRGVERRKGETTLPMNSLKRRVPFPSWSWLGWLGPVTSRIEDDDADRGIVPLIICYILRNTPLRLVRVARIANDNPTGTKPVWSHPASASKSPLVVTFDKIYSECPSLTPDRLADTPDDQLLFFFAETAWFTLSNPIPSIVVRQVDRYKVENCCEVLDRNGVAVGKTQPISPSTLPKRLSDTEPNMGEFEFIALADTQYVKHEAHKLVLQIQRKEGVAYRVNIAEIKKDAWECAGPETKLIAMG